MLRLNGFSIVLSLAILSAGLATPASAGAGQRSQNQIFEMEFLASMIDHHAIAVQMAQLCRSRATHAELLQMCSDIAKNQSMEIQQMQTWLGDWYDMQGAPHQVEHDEADMTTLAGLSGAAFEKAFMEQMAPHHMVALQQAAECLVRASHGELVGMCQDMADSQAAEIKTLRTWLCRWYSVCSMHFRRSAVTGRPEPLSN